jgi:hypothetical protein
MTLKGRPTTAATDQGQSPQTSLTLRQLRTCAPSKGVSLFDEHNMDVAKGLTQGIKKGCAQLAHGGSPSLTFISVHKRPTLAQQPVVRLHQRQKRFLSA